MNVPVLPLPMGRMSWTTYLVSDVINCPGHQGVSVPKAHVDLALADGGTTSW